MIKWLLLLLPIALMAEPPHVYQGQKLPKLEATGFVRLIECEVTGLTKITGTLETTDCILNSTIVDGTTFLRGTSLHKKGEFTGKFTARNSNFLMPIYIESSAAQLAKCRTHKIVMKSRDKLPIYLHLTDTQVFGDIVFQQGSGYITLDRGSSIKGMVKGGRIIKHGASSYN